MIDKFYRHDNMKIRLGPVPGRGICLTFEITDPAEAQTETLSAICNWIQQKVRWLDDPQSAMVKKTSPFIQSSSSSYLMIEFWSNDRPAIRDVTLLLMGRFEFVAEMDFVSLVIKPSFELHPHQKDAIDSMMQTGSKHTMVIPTKYKRREADQAPLNLKEMTMPKTELLYSRTPDSAYPEYKSEDGVYVVKREYTGSSPNYVEFHGQWVLRKDGEYVDHDGFINDLIERHTLRCSNA